MALFDTESLIKLVEIKYKANLNAELLLIDAEKNDFVLAPLNDKAWYLLQLPRVWSYEQNVIWGLMPTENLDIQSDNTLERINIFFEVAIPDEGSEINEESVWKLLRYTRALKAVAHKNIDIIQGFGRLKVTSLLPAKTNAAGVSFLSAGVVLQASKTSN